MKHIVVLIITLLSNLGIAQVDKEVMSSYLNNLSEIRTSVLEQHSDSLEYLGPLMVALDTCTANYEDKMDFIATIASGIRAYKLSHEDMVEKMEKNKKFTPDQVVFLTKEHYNLIKHYYLIFELITIGALADNYPFAIAKSKSLIDEINFYGITKGDRVAELGAGSGIFSAALACMELPAHMAINELESSKCKAIYDLFNFIDPLVDNLNAEIIQGSKISTNLDSKFDKIIVRNTLHHFKKIDAMLNSIYKSLESDGQLCIQEYPRIEDVKPDCKKRMYVDEIIDTIKKSGFRLIDSLSVSNGGILFKFEKFK